MDRFYILLLTDNTTQFAMHQLDQLGQAEHVKLQLGSHDQDWFFFKCCRLKSLEQVLTLDATLSNKLLHRRAVKTLPYIFAELHDIQFLMFAHVLETNTLVPQIPLAFLHHTVTPTFLKVSV